MAGDDHWGARRLAGASLGMMEKNPTNIFQLFAQKPSIRVQKYISVVIRTTSTTRDFVIFELGPVSGSFEYDLS